MQHQQQVLVVSRQRNNIPTISFSSRDALHLSLALGCCYSIASEKTFSKCHLMTVNKRARAIIRSLALRNGRLPAEFVSAFRANRHNRFCWRISALSRTHKHIRAGKSPPTNKCLSTCPSTAARRDLCHDQLTRSNHQSCGGRTHAPPGRDWPTADTDKLAERECLTWAAAIVRRPGTRRRGKLARFTRRVGCTTDQS